MPQPSPKSRSARLLASRTPSATSIPAWTRSRPAARATEGTSGGASITRTALSFAWFAIVPYYTRLPCALRSGADTGLGRPVQRQVVSGARREIRQQRAVLVGAQVTHVHDWPAQQRIIGEEHLAVVPPGRIGVECDKHQRLSEMGPGHPPDRRSV